MTGRAGGRRTQGDVIREARAVRRTGTGRFRPRVDRRRAPHQVPLGEGHAERAKRRQLELHLDALALATLTSLQLPQNAGIEVDRCPGHDA
jgi:hypothetical protein